MNGAVEKVLSPLSQACTFLVNVSPEWILFSLWDKFVLQYFKSILRKMSCLEESFHFFYDLLDLMFEPVVDSFFTENSLS